MEKGKKSVCNSNKWGHHAPLCYCTGSASGSGKKTLREILKNSQTTVDRVTTFVKGFSDNLQAFASETPEIKGDDLLELKRHDSVVSRETSLGDSWKDEGKDSKGNKLFSAKNFRRLNKVGQSLGSLCTAVAPIFIVGDLVWGSTEDQ